MLVIIVVVFSKERATRVFVVAFLTIGGIIVLNVENGGFVCESYSACRALVIFQGFLLHGSPFPDCPRQARPVRGRQVHFSRGRSRKTPVWKVMKQ